MDNETSIRLIEMYGSFKELWDPRQKEYHNKNKREDLWNEIANNFDLPKKELKAKMKSLLSSYRRERNREKTSNTTGLGRNQSYTSKWFAYEAFHFLHDKNNPIDTSDTMRRRNRGGKRRSHQRSSTSLPDDSLKNVTSTEVPVARSGSRKREKKVKKNPNYDMYDPGFKDWESGYVEMPKDLYQAHLRPGVIFRIHMSEAVLKMQYRNYGEDKDESVIEADVEYLRLTRKVINDEITKFEDLQWLTGWFYNRSDLIQEHMCNTRYYTVGTPPTMFTHSEEYMKRLCLFDGVYLDHIPYVIGEDGSIMAAVAPPVLHCDAATCTSVPFIDSVMFDERLPRTNVRTLTRCQASCRAHCRNDPDCLKRCSDRCLRTD